MMDLGEMSEISRQKLNSDLPLNMTNEDKMRHAMCVGCGAQIQDQYILRVAPDLEWHASCLKCADCGAFLDESCTCFVRDGKTYCKRDYLRLFGAKCENCDLGFTKSDFVMRARNKIYHLDCFRCVACARALVPGDEFSLRDNGLFCRADNDILEQANLANGGPDTPIPGSATPGGLSYENNNNKSIISNNNSDTKPALTSLENQTTKSSSSASSNSSTSSRTNVRERSGRKGDHKPTRVRTVLNEKQLHTLRTCYTANPRPDALMKEQLTEMTNLSPRVIRVWFQNKRCKDKKRSIAMKQMQEQQAKSGSRYTGTMQGVPMVASSPVRHESGMQPNPVEVQSYQQPPWKALTEFAIQSEIDQPPFQQLVNSFDTSQDSGIVCNSSVNTSPMDYDYGHMQDDVYSHDPNSVSSSEIPPSPEDMSSPLSQC